jgi:copper resistance protein B
MSARMLATLGLAIAASLLSAPALAQHAGHAPPATAPAPATDPHAHHAPKPKPKAKPKAASATADPHAHHAPMPKPQPKPKAKPKPTIDPHAQHAKPTATVDPHAQHAAPEATADPHAQHSAPKATVDPHAQHAAPATPPDPHAHHAVPAATHAPVPALTDADRAAAFPDVHGHAAHDREPHGFWLFDKLEAREGGAAGWETEAWVGGDVHRLWVRTEGELHDGELDHASVELLAGRGVSAWWDVVAGVRHDLGDAPSQSFLAVGVQGLAPYKIELEATAYLGSGGQSALRVEAGYETLLTNRWIVQWDLEAEAFGRGDARRGHGAGLATLAAGARLRYAITPRIAPYVGIEVERAFGATADFHRDRGDSATDRRLVAGIRFWF